MKNKIKEFIFYRWAIHIDHWLNSPFYNFPLSKHMREEPSKDLELWELEKKKTYPKVDRIENEIGFAIDQEWLHILALSTQIVIKKSELCYQHGRLLYTILADYIRKAEGQESFNILETGTARGFSSLCMAKALEDAGRAGTIYTIDLIPHNTKMFWNCYEDRNGPQTRKELLLNYKEMLNNFLVFIQGDSRIQLKKFHLPRIHFAFLDGAHTYRHVMHEFRYVMERQEPGDIIFFDDYTPALFPGIVKAVDEICDTHPYESESLVLSEGRSYAFIRRTGK